MSERDGLSLVMGIEHKCIPKSNNRTRAITAIIDGVENTPWITVQYVNCKRCMSNINSINYICCIRNLSN